ncbi:hypothetical protein J4233_04105 [Candidatus Pacearchaeota archaeon]|nr:hypothetical protein [Candidatus Pacearchaeota archaeon]
MKDEPDEKLIEKYNKIYKSKCELYKLLKGVGKSTKLGRFLHNDDDYYSINFGGAEVSSSLEYGHVRFTVCIEAPHKWREYEFDDDLEMILGLTKEIKIRFKEFQVKRGKNKFEYAKAKKKFAKEIFDKLATPFLNGKFIDSEMKIV